MFGSDLFRISHVVKFVARYPGSPTCIIYDVKQLMLYSFWCPIVIFNIGVAPYSSILCWFDAVEVNSTLISHYRSQLYVDLIRRTQFHLESLPLASVGDLHFRITPPCFYRRTFPPHISQYTWYFCVRVWRPPLEASHLSLYASIWMPPFGFVHWRPSFQVRCNCWKVISTVHFDTGNLS